MHSADGRFVIVLNGEIYNFKALRDELSSRGRAFRTDSDTEVLLAAFERFGVAEGARHCVGMFAAALVDTQNHQLFLVRDRLGEKPLYYGWLNQTFVFASELKAFHSFSDWSPTIDRDAITLMLRHGNVPAPHCIYQGLSKLPPATVATIDFGEHASKAALQQYWSATTTAANARQRPVSRDYAECQDLLLDQLRQVIAGQAVADVPLGAFLSGGTDSSLVVAVLQESAGTSTRTFSIGFNEAGYDEAPFAAAVAAHLGTAHTELYITSAQAQAVVPQLPTLFDEPFADSSQIPTYLVAALARESVTVSLSGDGGDELFGGYDRYGRAQSLFAAQHWLPSAAGRAVRALARSRTAAEWDHLLAPLQRWLPTGRTTRLSGDRILKTASLLAVSERAELYRKLVSLWDDPASIVIGGQEPPSLLSQRDRRLDDWPSDEWMMLVDSITYLPDDILVKVDRAAMSRSLETRAPFLDHRLFELAWRLPHKFKRGRRNPKRILKDLLRRYLPPELVDRPKMGFGVPIDLWLRGPLRGWASDLLAPDRLRAAGYFAVEPIQQRWREHLSGERNWQHNLWCILMFEAWRDAWPSRSQPS